MSDGQTEQESDGGILFCLRFLLFENAYFAVLGVVPVRALSTCIIAAQGTAILPQLDGVASKVSTEPKVLREEKKVAESDDPVQVNVPILPADVSLAKVHGQDQEVVEAHIAV